MKTESNRLTTQSDTGDPILDPVGETRASRELIAHRLDTLEGATIGLLDNCKTNADIFLEEVGQILRDEYGVEEVIGRRKSKSAIPAGELVIHLAEQTDAIVNAYGDCGSCTSWTVYDSVEFEKNHGIPTATVESTEFLKLAQAEARAQGLPGLPLIEIPHPMGSVSVAIVRDRARIAVSAIVHVLTTPAETLDEQFMDKFLDADEELGDEDLRCPL